MVISWRKNFREIKLVLSRPPTLTLSITPEFRMLCVDFSRERKLIANALDSLCKEYKVQLFRHRLIKTLSRNGCYRAALPCNLTLTIWRNQFHFWREKHKVLGLLLRPPRRFQQPWHILSRFQWVSHLTWQTKPQAFTTHEKSERFLERGSVLLTRLMNVAAPDVSPHQVAAAAAAAKSLSLA